MADVAAAIFMVAIVRAGDAATIDFQTLGGFVLWGTYGPGAPAGLGRRLDPPTDAEGHGMNRAVVPVAVAPLQGIGEPQWAAVATVGLLLVPISVWIAVTRHGLYEIDRLISRGLSWAVLSGLLVAVYAGAVLLLQGVLGNVIQGETVAVAASTLLAAALFQPLRGRVQRAMDRRFNRTSYDAQRTVEGFAARLRDEVDLALLRASLVDTVENAVRPVSATIWLRPESEGVR